MSHLHLEYISRALQLHDAVIGNSNTTTSSSSSHQNNVGPLTGIIIGVFFGVTVALVLIEMFHILDATARWMNGRSRSEILDRMSDKEYEKFLVSKRPYSGIKADVFPRGCFCGLFPPGAFEDFLHTLANEHHFLAMIFVDKLNPFSKTERAVAFLIMHSFIFMLTAAATTANTTDYWLISLLVIAPSRILVDKFLYYLFGMPCLVSCCSCFRCCMEGVGHTVGAILFALSFVLMWVGALLITISFSQGPQQEMIIWNYLYSVFVTSSVQEAALIALVFVDKRRCCCSCLNSMSCGMLGVGHWGEDKEKRLKELEMNVNPDMEAGKGGARVNQIVPQPVVITQPPQANLQPVVLGAQNETVGMAAAGGAIAAIPAGQQQQQQPMIVVQGTMVNEQPPPQLQPQPMYIAQPQPQVVYVQQQPPPGYYVQQQPGLMMVQQGPGGMQYMAVPQQQPMMVMMTPM